MFSASVAPWLWWVIVGLALAALALNLIRWIRVAQREHYIAGRVSRIHNMWLQAGSLAMVLRLLGFAFAIVAAIPGPMTALFTFNSIAALVLSVLTPIGLGFRGKSAPLAWTARAKRLAVIFVAVAVVVGAVGVVFLGPGVLPLVVMCSPFLMDAALWVAAGIEKRLSHKYLVSAKKRLDQVKPQIIAITGSYGKTSTKGYLAHILSAQFPTVASPASFNNLMGLSRAVNDRLTPGTQYFIAEMGAYKMGEIAELAGYFPPDISAITVMGEAHLERMGSLANIVKAKSEIVQGAKLVVLPVDQEPLRRLADKCEADGQRVIRVSTGATPEADVVLTDGKIRFRDLGQAHASPTGVTHTGAAEPTQAGAGQAAGTEQDFEVPSELFAHQVNVVLAAGIGYGLGMQPATIAERLQNLPTTAHRAAQQQTQQGAIIIDDTFNSNPIGATKAVRDAARLANERGGGLIVVTPGMMELGPLQFQRNRELGETIAQVGGQLLVVGKVNRQALLAGAKNAALEPQTFASRKDAVAVAIPLAGEKGVILYENDLPDHYI